MGRTVAMLALAALSAAGCGGRSVLVGGQSPSRSTRPSGPPNAYLAQLGAEQAQLAAAERAIPTAVRTPAALSRSIGLLAAAIARLAHGLGAIKPPAVVDSLHARLISTARIYAAALTVAAHRAASRGGEPQADRLLLAATTAASASFTRTVAAIKNRLRAPAGAG